MNDNIKRNIITFFLMLTLPIFVGEVVLYQEITSKALETEGICKEKVSVQEPLAMPSDTPTATPSPTLRPRFVPVIVTPTGVK